MPGVKPFTEKSYWFDIDLRFFFCPFPVASASVASVLEILASLLALVTMLYQVHVDIQTGSPSSVVVC